jgi:putative endonuclease
MESAPEKKLRARAFGLEKEDEARAWFEREEGGVCLAFRDRWKGGEIDLIFEVPRNVGMELVFIEVRARSSDSFSGALGSVGPAKLRRISRSVERFLSRYRGSARTVRFDVLAWEANRWIHLKNLWPLPAAGR